MIRRLFIYMSVVCLPNLGYCQSSSVQGSVSMPSLIDLEVSYPNKLQIGFDNLEEFAHGKEYHNCINLSVKSNCPWVVTVKSGNSNFQSPANARSVVPSSIISLKPSGSNAYVPVTNAPTPILVSNNDDICNKYTLDLKMNTPWNAEGGQYDLNMVFSISPQ